MNQALYDRLVQAARERQPLKYSDIAPLADLDMRRADHRNRMAELLGEVSAAEHAAGRPMLSAVVVRGDATGGGLPGAGFFTLARQLGAQQPGESDVAFFAAELNRVFDHWRG